MGRKSFVLLVASIFSVVVISGCSTVPKKRFNEEMSGIKTRVETLETRVEGVEAKQAATEQAMVTTTTKTPEPSWPETNFTTKDAKAEVAPAPKASTREVQMALKKAGYYSGKVDGVKGRNTKRAIKAFQRDHGLAADGVVGKKTWELLSKYASGGVSGEEGIATK